MRKYIFIIAGLLPILAQAQPVERIFVATDRSVYVAGEQVGCSLFCIDAGTGKKASFSAVSYLELIGAQGTVSTAKIGLMEGRGTGRIRIPATTPTGNYRLVAYTAANTGEKGTGWMLGAGTISVFNTASTARVKDGVEIMADDAYKSLKAPEEKTYGLISFSTGLAHTGQPFTLTLYNKGKAADIQLSVYALDNILPPVQDGDIASFLEQIPSSMPEGRIKWALLPEYEGEILYAVVEGLTSKQLEALSHQAIATLSSAGSPTDVYVGKVGDNGKLLFFTNNIYGDRELVCQINGKDGGYIRLTDPFIHPTVESPAPLVLSKAQETSLLRRKSGLNCEVQLDTLVQFLPRRQDFLLEDLSFKRYHLDNYTRFPSFEEVIVEIVKELRIRTAHGRHELHMVVTDAVGAKKITRENILVMLDGVVISDLGILEGMDAMLLEDIDLYPHNIALGGLSYQGVVNFITRKNYVKAIKFPDNVRVIDFQGASYPVAYLGGPVSGTDYRQLLYWHPALQVEETETVRIPLLAPAYTGRFCAVAQGWDADGSPVKSVYVFEVK